MERRFRGLLTYSSPFFCALERHPLFKGLVPALGPSVIPTLEVSTPSSTSMTFELPPSPATMPTAPRAPYPHVERVAGQTDPEVLKPGLIRDLEETERAWSLYQGGTPGAIGTSSPSSGSSQPALLTAANVGKSTTSSLPPDAFDVLPVLQTTTRTIRSVRNYLVSLPDDYTVHPAHPPASAVTAAPKPAAHHLGLPPRRPVPPARAKAAAAAATAPVPFPSSNGDPFTKIRKAALDVLSMLRLVEESSRIPLSDDAYDSLSVGSGAADVLSMSEEYLLSSVSRSHTPPNVGSGSSTVTTTSGRGAGSLFSGDEDDNESMTSASAAGGGAAGLRSPGGSRFLKPNSGATTLVPLKGLGGGTVQVWADEDDPFDLNVQDSPQKKEAWDERLVLGGGWLYKTIPASSLGEQRAVVAQYLDVVDEILFGGPNGAGTPLGSKVASPKSPTLEDAPATREDAGYRRGWQRVRASLPTSSKMRRGRSSLGPTSPNEVSAGPGSLRRISSAGTLGELVAEPEEMSGSGYGDYPRKLGSFDEEEEEEEEDLGQFEDEELPEWARRDRFGTDPLGESCLRRTSTFFNQSFRCVLIVVSSCDFLAPNSTLSPRSLALHLPSHSIPHSLHRYLCLSP